MPLALGELPPVDVHRAITAVDPMGHLIVQPDIVGRPSRAFPDGVPGGGDRDVERSPEGVPRFGGQ